MIDINSNKIDGSNTNRVGELNGKVTAICTHDEAAADAASAAVPFVLANPFPLPAPVTSITGTPNDLHGTINNGIRSIMKKSTRRACDELDLHKESLLALVAISTQPGTGIAAAKASATASATRKASESDTNIADNTNTFTSLKNETLHVLYSKRLVFIVLLVATAALSIGVYFTLTRDERDAFEHAVSAVFFFMILHLFRLVHVSAFAFLSHQINSNNTSILFFPPLSCIPSPTFDFGTII
jgi:hypothetical protein